MRSTRITTMLVALVVGLLLLASCGNPGTGAQGGSTLIPVPATTVQPTAGAAIPGDIPTPAKGLNPVGTQVISRRPPGPSWIKQEGKWKDKNADGAFSVLAVSGNEQELLIFYSLKASQRGLPQVSAQSVIEGKNGTPATGEDSLKVTQVQALGSLAEYDVGVIRVAWSFRTGQVVALSVTPPGGAKPSWLVEPMKQNGTEAGSGAGTFFTTEPAALGEVAIACPCGPSFFKLALLGRSPKEVPIIYVKVDRQLAVSVVTQQEYESLMPPRGNGPTPGPTEDVEHPYFAPTYPPTATP